MTVDDVWTAMHVVKPGAASTDDVDLPLFAAGAPRPTDNRSPTTLAHPYWTIGDTQGESIGMTAPGGDAHLRQGLRRGRPRCS